MQNHPYFQHPASSPKFHPTPQNNELQPDNQRPRDDYFYASHYTWHHDSDQTDDDTNPAMYQAQAQMNDPAMYQAQAPAMQLSPAMQQPWEPHTHEISPAMYQPGAPHTHDIDPAMFHPWGLHTHELSPAPWGPHTHDVSPAPWSPHTHDVSPAPWGPQTHDVSPAMFNPMDTHYDPHPEGWAHYSVDYHYDWYQHWDDDQRAHDFYPAGYHPWLDYRW